MIKAAIRLTELFSIFFSILLKILQLVIVSLAHKGMKYTTEEVFIQVRQTFRLVEKVIHICFI